MAQSQLYWNNNCEISLHGSRHGPMDKISGVLISNDVTKPIFKFNLQVPTSIDKESAS